MKIDDIIDKIEKEKQISHRFPSRIILTRNLSDYNSLVTELKNVCECRFDLATFCKNDLVPKFKELNAELKKNKDKTILILSLGEYLRLCPLYENDKDRGGGFKSLWESADFVSTTTKYIMPIFGGREVFDNVINSVDDRQKDFIWEIDDDSADTEINITVYSPEFAKAVKADAENFSDWIAKWSTLYSEARLDFSLITKLCRYTDTSLGNVKIEKIDKPFSYIKSRVIDGELLTQEMGDNSFWSEVVTKLQPNTSFVNTIDKLINATLSFDSAAVLLGYKDWSNTKRQLFALRCRLYPTGDYISYAVNKAVTVDTIPESVRDSIFDLAQPTVAQYSERKQLLSVLPVTFDAGDHGSSRLAALSFHAGDTFVIPPPKNSKVRAFGRFCEIQNENDLTITDDMELVTSHNYKENCDKQCVVIKNYDHFKQSGNAAAGNTDEKDVCGEVHGGMTPEEYLVPVFIIKRTNPLEDLTVKKKRSALISVNDMGLG